MSIEPTQRKNGMSKAFITAALVVSMCLSMLPLVAMDIGATPIPSTISTPMTITTDTTWDSGTSTISANLTVKSPATLTISNVTINFNNTWSNNSGGGGGGNKTLGGMAPMLDFSSYFGFKIESGAKLIIRNSTFQGKTKSDVYNIVSEGNVDIRGSTFKQLDYDGIYVDGSTANPILKDNKFSNSNDGIRLNGITANINNNSFTSLGNYGIRSSNSVITIVDNTFSSVNYAIYEDSDTCTIELNDIDTTGNGIDLQSSTCTVRNNTVYSSSYGYLGLNAAISSKNYNIYDNEFHTLSVAMQIQGTGNVFNNDIHDCDQGIYAYPGKGGGGGGGAQIVWNTLTSVRYQGISASDAFNVVISNNTISKVGDMFNSGSGLSIGGMTTGIVADNIIKTVTGFGVTLRDGATNVQYNNNQISDVTAGNNQPHTTGAVNVEYSWQGNTWDLYPYEFNFSNVEIAFRGTESSNVNIWGWDLTGKDVGTYTDVEVYMGNWQDTNFYLYDTLYDNYNVDSNSMKWGNSVQASFTPYWSTDFTGFWESDNSSVDLGSLTVTDSYGSETFTGDTDTNGFVGPFYLAEFSKTMVFAMGNGTTTTTEKEFSPYTFLLSKDLKGKTYSNSTNVSINGITSVYLSLDDVLPFITITSPEDGFLTNQTFVIVEGMTEVLSEVTINGVVASVFKNGGFEATIPLSIEGKNTITVAVIDKGKNERSASINVTRDTVAPDLTVTAPEQDDIFNKMTVTVKGTTEPGANLTVNGKVVAVANDGSWNTTVTYTKEGTNSVTVISRDLAGNTVSVSRTFILDITPPNLIIGKPLNNTMTKNPSIEVSGSVEKGAVVNVNGKKIIYDGSLFTTSVELVDGPNLITVTATDAAGNSNTAKLTVTRDSVPPALDVKNPPDNLRTSKFSITVNGTTEKGAIVKINSIEVPNTNGTFSDTVFLNDGSNKITVEATDAAGNTATKVRKVFKEVGGTADPVTVTSPANGTVVASSTVTISGSLNELGILVVNGQRVTPDTNDNFEYTANLVEGKNTITLTLTDTFGNNFTMSWTVVRDTTPPNIVITSPKAKVGTANVLVQGTTEPGATVTVNGLMVYVSATGEFKAPATLNPGKNKIYVTAVDKVGNADTKTVEVRYEPEGGTTSLGMGSPATLGLFLLLIILVVIIMVLMLMLMSRMRKDPGSSKSEIVPEPETKAESLDDDDGQEPSEEEEEEEPAPKPKAPASKPPASKPLPPPLPPKKGDVKVEIKK